MTRAANGAICGPCRACMAERDALKAALVLETERCGEWATNAAMWAAERDVLKAEVERLRGDVELAKASLRTAKLLVETYEAERDQARARIATLEAALRKYSDHLPNCRRWTGHAEGEGTPWTDPTRPCTCGLDAALAGGG